MNIYKIVNNITEDFYIGKTIFDIQYRFKRHCYISSLKEGDSVYLYRAMRKYGINNFTCELVEKIDNDKDGRFLNDREIYWIDILKPSYNMTRGGDGGDTSSSPAYKEYSKIKSERVKGALNPFYGKHHTNEVKKKISEGNKGKIRSDSFKENLRLKNTGRKMSEEAVQKTIDRQSKEWKFLSPEGDEITIVNLTKFCRENNLDQGNMMAMIKGKGKSCKGYKRIP